MTKSQHGGVASFGRAATDHAAPSPTNPICILPGCQNPVSGQGLPCDECTTAFGSRLHATAGAPMTVDDQASRDRETRHARSAAAGCRPGYP
jgi:hypothetical protein